jgi:hypothetical protein
MYKKRKGISVEELLPNLRDVVEEAEEAAMTSVLRPAAEKPQLHSTTRELLRVLVERGSAYGEDFPFILGEEGIYYLALTKLIRTKWALDNGLNTREHWLDLAGYAVLQMAALDYKKERSA